MHPILFRIPILNLPVNSYGFMIMVGFLLATYIAVRRGVKQGIKNDLILDVGIISMIFGIIGAKVNYLLQYPSNSEKSYEIFNINDGGLNWLGAILVGIIPYLFWYWRTVNEPKTPLMSWRNAILLAMTLLFAFAGARGLHLFLNRETYDWSLIKSWQSGFVLYGGMVAGVTAGCLYAKMRGESVLKVSDLTAAPIMLGIAFGRLGCFLNGCCYGKVTTGFPGVEFPRNSAPFEDQLNAKPPLIDYTAEHSLRVHPTQLYEAAACIAFFFLLSWFWKKKKKHDGELVLLAGMLYPAWRFSVEFMRGDERPLWIGPLTYSQVLSLLIFIACAIGFFFVRTRPTPLSGTPGDQLAPVEKPA